MNQESSFIKRVNAARAANGFPPLDTPGTAEPRLYRADAPEAAKRKHPLLLLLAAVVVLACRAVLAWVVMLLWNVLSPVFHGPLLTYWQAAAMVTAAYLIMYFFKQFKNE